MQDAFLIDDSLANNIIFGSKDFDEKIIIDSLKLSGAWEFVKILKWNMKICMIMVQDFQVDKNRE